MSERGTLETPPGRPLEASRRRAMLGIGGLLLAAWLGVNAVWGLTSPADTLVAGWLRALAPLSGWVAAAAAVLVAAALVSVLRRDRRMLTVAAVLFAYLLGVLGSRWAKLLAQPDGTIVDRSFLLLPVLPMAVAVWLLGADWKAYPLRFGDWRVETALFAAPTRSWARWMPWALLWIGLPAVVLMQAGAGFAPVASGTLWAALPTIAALAALNAVAEELLFRGFLQPPLVAAAGRRWGVGLQAGFFAVHHWGASPEPIASLPMVGITLALGLLWGKAAHETRGLGWSVTLHAALDLAFLSAYYPGPN